MVKSLSLFALLGTVHGVMGMEVTKESLNLNLTINAFTQKMAEYAYQNSPEKNTIVSGVGPTLQLLATSVCLKNTENPDSTESQIQEEIFKELGVSAIEEARELLDQTSKLTNNWKVKNAHLMLISKEDEAEEASSFDKKWGITLLPVNIHNPEEAASEANKFTRIRTQGYLESITTPADFTPNTTSIFLSSLFMATKWEHYFAKTYVKFEDKEGPKLVKGIRDTQYVYIYDSPKDSDNPYQIIYIRGETENQKCNNYLCIKMHHNGSVSPITTEEFKQTANIYSASLKIPVFNFQRDVDVDFFRQTFPTLFANEYQTTYSKNPVSLSTLKQKNFIEIDENGMKAGSITMKVEGSLGMGPKLERLISVDKPFSFVVINKTDLDTLKSKAFTHLFSGTVVNLPAVTSKDAKYQYMKVCEWDIDDLKQSIYEHKKSEDASPEKIEELNNLKTLKEAEYLEANKTWSEAPYDHS